MNASTSNPEAYERFGRSGRRNMGIFGSGFAVSRLYIAATHLLCVDIIFFSEQCKRYQFKHIEALWYVPTKGWHVNTVFCALCACPLLLAFLIPDAAVLAIWLTIPLCVLIAVLIMNIRRGPSCRCYIRTAAHTDQLPAINRVALAEAFFARVGPLIEESQADVVTFRQAPPLATEKRPPAEDDESGRISLSGTEQAAVSEGG